MSAEQIRSIGNGPIGAILSALVASIIFHWQVRCWAHRMPTKFGKKDKDRLLSEYKMTNRIAKVFGLAGIATLFVYYRGQSSTGKDWRGLGIAWGLACSLPVFYVVMANIGRGADKVKEALVAFVVDQITPPKVLFGIIAISVMIGLACAISCLFYP